MINPSFKELEHVSKSRYEIVMMAAKRARMIVDHSQPLIDEVTGNKPVTIAIEEIMEGKIDHTKG